MDLDNRLSEYGLSENDITDIDRAIFQQRAKPPKLYVALVISTHLFPALLATATILFQVDFLHATDWTYDDLLLVGFISLLSARAMNAKTTILNGYPFYRTLFIFLVLLEAPLVYSVAKGLQKGVFPALTVPYGLEVGVVLCGIASLRAVQILLFK